MAAHTRLIVCHPSQPLLWGCSYRSRHTRGQCCSQIEPEEPAAASPKGLPTRRKEAFFLFCFPVAAGQDPLPASLWNTELKNKQTKKQQLCENRQISNVQIWHGSLFCVVAAAIQWLEKHFISSRGAWWGKGTVCLTIMLLPHTYKWGISWVTGRQRQLSKLCVVYPLRCPLPWGEYQDG